MHASAGRQVQSEVSGAAARARRLPPAQTHETGSQDLRDFGEALVSGHQIGRQSVDTS
jgi:hypothetical protein